MPVENPEIVVSDRDKIDIISPQRGLKIGVTIHPDNTVATTIEYLLDRADQQREVEAYFINVTRHLILSMLESDAARVMSGTEVISPEIDVLNCRIQFVAAVKGLARMGYTDREVLKLIRDQGRQITLGEVRMGEIPPAVREKVDSLFPDVSEIYKNLQSKSG